MANSEQNLEHQALLTQVYGASEHALDVVVVAAGVGSRMQSAVPKQYLRLDEQTVLEHTVKNILSSKRVKRVILVLSAQDEYFAHTSVCNHPQITTVLGGKERVDSVLAGLQAVRSEWVMVHDVARPFINAQAIDELLIKVAQAYSAQKAVGGLLVNKVSDTLKQVKSHDCKELLIDHTVDRSSVYAAQTPQLFKCADLIEAIKQAQQDNVSITDEASAIEHCQQQVLIVVNASSNFKITTQDDLFLARALLSYHKENK